MESQTLPYLYYSWPRLASFHSERFQRKDFQVSCSHWLDQIKMAPCNTNPVKNLYFMPLRWVFQASSHLRRRYKTFGRSGPCDPAMCDTVIKFWLGWPWNPELRCVTRKTVWSLWQIYHSLGPRRCRLFRQSLRSNCGSVARPSACPPSCDRETMALYSTGRSPKKNKTNTCTFIFQTIHILLPFTDTL